MARTVFLGTSAFAAHILERLAAGPHRPALVITRPDRPSGRGRKLQAPPVAEAARELGLELSQPEDLEAPEALDRIAAARPEVLCVCAYGVIVREPLLSVYEILNVHPSLLPRWRGAAPIERTLMAGDARTGVSIMRLEAGLDSGPVCLQEAIAVACDDDYASLSARLELLGGELLVRALDQSPAFREQPEEGVTYAEKITPQDRTLDSEEPPERLERVVRALRPHIGARLVVPEDGSLLRVIRAKALPGAPSRGDGRLRATQDAPTRLELECRGGVLELLEVQPPGGRPMTAADWLRGHPVPD